MPTLHATIFRGGGDGRTGWVSTSQVEEILRIRPWAIRLEMTDNALNVNNGAEVDWVINQLEQHCIIWAEVLEVWRYGDPSSRNRLSIVGSDIRAQLEQWVLDTRSRPEYQNMGYPLLQHITCNEHHVLSYQGSLIIDYS